MHKKKIVLTLDERYINKEDLSKAAYEYLKQQGHKCEILDVDTIMIDGAKYMLNEWNTNALVPVQQIVLKLMN